jgi:metallo-beta-lactamase family protein
MRLTFFGAAGRVTGSCHILEVGGRTLLLDCGLLQGGRKEEALNREPFPFDPLRLDAVVLSHAHIDHSGRLPLLVKAGYRGPVWTHAATTDLCRVMLKDSAYLQEKEAEIQTRKRQRRGEPPVEPLYTLADAGAALRRFRSLDYGERTTILPGVDIRLLDAGHILGSAIVELWLTEGGQTRKLVFSGDLGQKGTPILEDPTPVAEADAVLMESTYGDRMHRSRSETVAELKGVLAEALRARGNVLVPAFAVGRSQEMLYLFSREYEDWGLDRWRICLDSPMAIAATAVYAEHEALHDADARRHWAERGKRLLPNLQIVRTAAQSRALNGIRSGLIIIAASGMCEGGRILHHLKNNLWRKECHVVIVGYQAAGRRTCGSGASRCASRPRCTLSAACRHTRTGRACSTGTARFAAARRCGSCTAKQVRARHSQTSCGASIPGRSRRPRRVRASTCCGCPAAPPRQSRKRLIAREQGRSWALPLRRCTSPGRTCAELP